MFVGYKPFIEIFFMVIVTIPLQRWWWKPIWLVVEPPLSNILISWDDHSPQMQNPKNVLKISHFLKILLMVNPSNQLWESPKSLRCVSRTFGLRLARSQTCCSQTSACGRWASHRTSTMGKTRKKHGKPMKTWDFICLLNVITWWFLQFHWRSIPSEGETCRAKILENATWIADISPFRVSSLPGDLSWRSFFWYGFMDVS